MSCDKIVEMLSDNFVAFYKNTMRRKKWFFLKLYQIFFKKSIMGV